MDLIAERHRVKGEKKKIIHSIERADLKPKEITDWIDAVNKNPRQAPTVVYSKQFPDIDNLMQVKKEKNNSKVYRYGLKR